MTYVATGKKLYVAIALFFLFIIFIYKLFIVCSRANSCSYLVTSLGRPDGQCLSNSTIIICFGYGGVFGTGYTSGFPRLIPEVHTDFIFAAIGEEFGLIGVTFLLLAYLLLFMRGVKLPYF